MKKLALILYLTIITVFVQAQTPTLNTLIRFVNTTIPDITEEIISLKGWELTKSSLEDSIVNLQFDGNDLRLEVKKVKNYKNEIFFVCNKLQYDNLNKSLLALKPSLVDSKVNEKGHVVKTYWGEKYGYRISIAPKSLFVFHVYDLKEFKENPTLPVKEITPSEGNNYGEGGSGFGETPIALRKFTNLVTPQDDGLKTGKIAVRIKINKAGLVIDATPGVKGTTLNDRELWQKCKEAILGARLAPSETAPDIQIGIIVFNFKVK